MRAGPSLEARRRLGTLLAVRDGRVRSTNALRMVRAIEVMERVGTAEVRELLNGIVKDLPNTWATDQAKLAVERLDEQR